jgi:carboxyl-terminal processing protease
MNTPSFRYWILALVMLAVGVQLGMSIQTLRLAEQTKSMEQWVTQTGIKDPEKNADLSIVWTAWRTLLQHYIAPEKIDAQKLVLGAAEGLVRAVGDPYTVFMSPTDSKDFRQSLNGSLEGIGAELTERDKLIVVAAPLKGSPAEKAGILPEDIILEVNGEATDGWSLNQVVSKVRGPRGTSVTLTLYRKGATAPIKVTIKREAITIPSVDSRLIDVEGGQVGYVELSQFGDHSTEEVRNALQEFRSKKIKGLILDLRYNGGGYLEGAIDLSSMFLREGKVVSVERRNTPTEVHEVSGNPVYPDVPMVVLMNEGSASASEITAGALQDNKRATVIGVKSFGKGTVQEVIELPGGSALRVTVAKWLTPNGKDLSKEGIHPDYVVERTIEQLQKQQDPQLDAALEFLATGKVTPQASSSSK